jgi:hypothetical protein
MRHRETMSDPFAPLRPRVPVPVPTKEVFAWWSSLTPAQRPVAMARTFPRIVNQIAACWSDYPACDKYLRSLLLEDQRDNRQGFPVAVAGEIMMLHDLLSRTQAAIDARSGNVPAASDTDADADMAGNLPAPDQN